MNTTEQCDYRQRTIPFPNGLTKRPRVQNFRMSRWDCSEIEREREINNKKDRQAEKERISLTFPTLRFSGQRTRLLEKKHRSWLTLPFLPSCLPILFPPQTCVSLVGRSGMRATSIRDFLRALTIIAWNVVIVCRRSKTTVSMYVTIYVNTGSWSNVRSKRGGTIRALSMYRSWRTLP